MTSPCRYPPSSDRTNNVALALAHMARIEAVRCFSRSRADLSLSCPPRLLLNGGPHGAGWVLRRVVNFHSSLRRIWPRRIPRR